MNQTIELPTIPMDADKAVTHITQILRQAGLHSIRSFDLQKARSMATPCRCSHHDTKHCSCQMVVLLIYGNEVTPTTLVAHGHEGKTYLALVDIPQQRPEVDTVDLIRQGLLAKGF